MRVLPTLCLAAFVVACESPTTPRSLTVPDANPRATIITQSHDEIVGPAVNDCNGETVLATVKIHDVFAVTLDGSGGAHIKLHENINGSAINPTSGATYELMQTLDIEFNQTLGTTLTFPLHFNLTGKGTTPNEVYQDEIHITTTPNGDVTSSHDHFVLQCQA
jgi:hypothetical protein